jgi:hypothetical protein
LKPVVSLSRPDGRGAPYSTGKKRVLPGDETADAVVGFSMQMFAGGTEIQTPDVWAMYSPRGNAMFAHAITTYINRAQNCGIRTPTATLGSGTVADLMQNPARREARNGLISGLSISSLADSLVWYAAHTHVDIVDLGWVHQKLDGVNPALVAGITNATATIPRLGIQKRFAGSWR